MTQGCLVQVIIFMEIQGDVRRVYNTSVITRRMSITIPAIHVERKIKP